jgi:hypothetical protein
MRKMRGLLQGCATEKQAHVLKEWSKFAPPTDIKVSERVGSAKEVTKFSPLDYPCVSFAVAFPIKQ